MKKSGKFLAVVLALLMVSGCLIFNVSAAGTPSGSESMQVTVKTDYASAHPGEYITVTLNIKNNYYATSMRFPVLFTAGVFEVVDADFNLQKLGQLSSVSGSLAANTTSNPAFYPAGYSGSDYGAVLIQWVGGSSAGVFGCYNQPAGQDCISFRLRLKAGASGVGTVLIPPESTLFYRQAMNNPADGNTVYTMAAAACPMTFTPVSVTVNMTPADVAVKDGAQTVIDRQNNFIYGLKSALDSLDDYIVPAGGAELEKVKSSETLFGTGSLVKVISNGVVVKTYKVVIFGDLNGDGNIDDADSGKAIDVANYKVVWNKTTQAYLYKAGDVNGDANIDFVDADIMSENMNWRMGINQVTGRFIVY